MTGPRPVVYFVTPAWRRLRMTRLCLEQRRWVIDELAKVGVEGRCVVVSDDENLAIASELGFETVKRGNEWLGRRFNDGIAYAAANGADWIVPIGSDSWIDPAYLYPLPEPHQTRTSTLYSVVDKRRVGELRVYGSGVGPYMIHRDRLPASRRPAADELRRGVDRSTLAGLSGLIWEYRDLHPLQYVGLRSAFEPQMNSFDRLYSRIGVAQTRDPFRRLATVYPAELVERAREVLR